MKDNTKGFTLIELLAVIVILAEKAAVEYLMDNNTAKITGACTVAKTKLTCPESIELTLDLKGDIPESGTVTFDPDGHVSSASKLKIGSYTVKYDDENGASQDASE